MADATPPPTDKDIVQGAYGDELKKITRVFIEAYMVAGGDAGQTSAAESRFKAGVSAAQKARDRAMTLL